MRIPGILLWKLNLTRADVDVVSAITTFFSWLVLAFPRGSPPPSVPVFITVAISDDPGSGSLSATVLLAIWGSLAMARSTVCWASPAGLEATQVKAPGTENKKIIVPDVHRDAYNDNTEQNATFQVKCFILLLQFRGSSCLCVVLSRFRLIIGSFPLSIVSPLSWYPLFILFSVFYSACIWDCCLCLLGI